MRIQARSHSNLSTITPDCCCSEIKVYQTKVAIEQPVISPLFDAASFLLIKAHSGPETIHNKQLCELKQGVQSEDSMQRCAQWYIIINILIKIVHPYINHRYIINDIYEDTLNLIKCNKNSFVMTEF